MIECPPSDLTGGQLFAIQFDSESDYAASLIALNNDVKFTPTGSTCEGADSSATVSWSSGNFPQTPGQLVECYFNTSNQPTYIWTLPTQSTILEAVGQAGSSIGDLYAWWHQYNTPSS